MAPLEIPFFQMDLYRIARERDTGIYNHVQLSGQKSSRRKLTKAEEVNPCGGQGTSRASKIRRIWTIAQDQSVAHSV